MLNLRFMIVKLKKWKRFIQAASGVVLLFVLFLRADFQTVKEHFLSTPIVKLFLLTIVVVFIKFLLSATGLFVFFRCIRKEKGVFIRILYVLPKLELLSFVMPGRIADSGLFLFFRDKYLISETTAVTVADKIVSLTVVCMLAIAGMIFYFGFPNGVVVGFCVLLLLVGLTWFLVAKRWHNAREKAKGFVPLSIANHISGFHPAIALILKTKWVIGVNFMMTILRSILYGGYATICYFLMGSSVNFLSVFFANSISQFVGLIPISISGLGIIEGCNMALLGKIGLSASLVLSFSLLGRFAHIIVVTILYFTMFLGSQGNNEQ